MLSPGQWYKDVPKDRQENLQYRLNLLGLCRSSKRYRRAAQHACRHDLLWYVNSFCWTFDPRTPDKFLPFVTWPFQDKAFLEIVECIEVGRDLVIEKSRDMGASWMSLTVMEWLWHFHPGHSFLMVSRKEDLVDAPGDPDSLFWKVDFIHRHLPNWLRPGTDRRKLHFGNLDNGSTIDGESTTAAAGVGGRRTAMFIDEFSRIEEGYQLLAGTADTTRCRIFNFTPFGTSNAAYKLARRGDVRKLRLHWSEHPEKARGLYRYDERERRVELLDRHFQHPPDFNFISDGRVRSPWYDGECQRRANDREVAQMLDIDYQGSAYQFFDRSLILARQAEDARAPYWEGDIAYDPDTGRPVALVRAPGGPIKLWTHLDAEGRPPLAQYAGGADISTGSGATNSVFSLADAKTGEKVLEYASPFLRAEEMAPRVTALCWLFKDEYGTPAKLCWEHAGPGLQFGKRVLELGFGHYWHNAEAQFRGLRVSKNPGWTPTNESKRLAISEYRAALSMRNFVNRSHIALEECLDYISDKSGNVVHSGEVEGINERGEKDPTGARVNHGDRVIADALCWKMVESFGMMRLSGRKKVDLEVKVGSLAWRRQLHATARHEDGW